MSPITQGSVMVALGGAWGDARSRTRIPAIGAPSIMAPEALTAEAEAREGKEIAVAAGKRLRQI